MQRTPTKANANSGPKVKPPAKRKLTARQERFAELVASGESQTDAWLQAGYKVSRSVARRNAAESLTIPDIAARVAELRKPQTAAACLTRDRKREILLSIAEDEAKPLDARLRAIAEDNKMAGHYEPDKMEIENGPNTLENIRERAAQVAAALDRNARRISFQTAPDRKNGFSRWNGNGHSNGHSNGNGNG